MRMLELVMVKKVSMMVLHFGMQKNDLIQQIIFPNILIVRNSSSVASTSTQKYIEIEFRDNLRGQKTLTSLAPLSLLFQCKEGVMRVKVLLSPKIRYSPYKSFNAVEFLLCGSLFFISLANMAVSLADIGGSKVAVVLLDSSGTNPALPSPPTTEFKTALLM